nr:hypothetical protein [Tanacetum cinerariifolium]
MMLDPFVIGLIRLHFDGKGFTYDGFESVKDSRVLGNMLANPALGFLCFVGLRGVTGIYVISSSDHHKPLLVEEDVVDRLELRDIPLLAPEDCSKFNYKILNTNWQRLKSGLLLGRIGKNMQKNAVSAGLYTFVSYVGSPDFEFRKAKSNEWRSCRLQGGGYTKGKRLRMVLANATELYGQMMASSVTPYTIQNTLGDDSSNLMNHWNYCNEIRQELFRDQVCWELPFMQGWLMGQSQAGTSSSNRAEVITTLPHVMSGASNRELLEASLVVIERPGLRDLSSNGASTSASQYGDIAMVNEPNDGGSSYFIQYSQFSASLTANAAAELPCTSVLALAILYKSVGIVCVAAFIATILATVITIPLARVQELYWEIQRNERCECPLEGLVSQDLLLTEEAHTQQKAARYPPQEVEAPFEERSRKPGLSITTNEASRSSLLEAPDTCGNVITSALLLDEVPAWI